MKGSCVKYYSYKYGTGRIALEAFEDSEVGITIGASGIVSISTYGDEKRLDKLVKCVEWFKDNYEKIRNIELENINFLYANRIIAEDCVR